MKKQYRILLWASLFIILLAAVAIISAYLGANFLGVGPVPTRSAFANRLPSLPGSDSNQRRFQFFYATNRANNDETFNGHGNILGNNILTGTFRVGISPYMPIKPMVWFDKDYIKWLDRHELSRALFDTQIRQAVQTSPKKSLLIIVWGFRDWFQSAALKTAYTAYALDMNTPVLLFDWPGNQGEGRSGYLAARRVSTQSAPDLGRTIAEVIQDTGAENVWIMGSSLGCDTICEALTWLKNQPELFQGDHKISHVILSAPDVSAQAFDDQFADTLNKVSKHLTAYVSSNDRALLMSQWLNGQRRLGRKAEVLVPPENRASNYEFEEAVELINLQTKGARNISIVDATPINFLRNLHHFFTDSSVFFDDLYQRLLQPDDILNRRLHAVRTEAQGTTYSILWNE